MSALTAVDSVCGGGMSGLWDGDVGAVVVALVGLDAVVVVVVVVVAVVAVLLVVVVN